MDARDEGWRHPKKGLPLLAYAHRPYSIPISADMGNVRIRNAPTFIIAGLSLNISSCYSLVWSYRSTGVSHLFRFPTFVPQTLTTSVTPVFGLNKSYDFIPSILLLTSPSTTASSTATPRPTTRTLTFHGAAFYKTLRIDEKFRPPGSTSSTTRTPCTPTRRRDAPPSTGRRVRSSTRIVIAPTTASGTTLRHGRRLTSLGLFFRIGLNSPTPCTTPRRFDYASSFDIAKKFANGHQVEDTAAVNEHRHR